MGAALVAQSEPSLSQVAAHSGKRLYNAGGELSWQTPPDALQNGPTAPQGALSQHAATQPTEPMPGFEGAGDRRAAHRIARGNRAYDYFRGKAAEGTAIFPEDVGGDQGEGVYSRFGHTPMEEHHRQQAYQALEQGRDPYGPYIAPPEPKTDRFWRDRQGQQSNEDWRRDVLDSLNFDSGGQ